MTALSPTARCGDLLRLHTGESWLTAAAPLDHPTAAISLLLRLHTDSAGGRLRPGETCATIFLRHTPSPSLSSLSPLPPLPAPIPFSYFPLCPFSCSLLSLRLHLDRAFESPAVDTGSAAGSASTTVCACVRACTCLFVDLFGAGLGRTCRLKHPCQSIFSPLVLREIRRGQEGGYPTRALLIYDGLSPEPDHLSS